MGSFRNTHALQKEVSLGQPSNGIACRKQQPTRKLGRAIFLPLYSLSTKHTKFVKYKAYEIRNNFNVSQHVEGSRAHACSALSAG